MKRILLALFLVIFLTNSVLATDVAYVVKSGANSILASELNNAGLTYDVITESQIASTNFSKYKMLLVGEGNFDNFEQIPVAEHNSLIINSYHFYQKGIFLISDSQWGWSAGKGSASSPTNLKFNTLNTTLVDNLPETFRAYTVQDIDLQTYYLTGRKATGTKLIVRIDGHTSGDSVLGLAYPGTIYLNGEIGQARSLFFGIVKPEYWTTESRQLFRNSLDWVLMGEDLDEDGFYTEEDCNDTNSSINPDAEEIAYDGIDQDCSGYDLGDIDGDGYCKIGYAIQNALSQCHYENGSFGTDCNDNSSNIHPGSSNLSLNCINNAPIISVIPNFVIRESQTITVLISASDPENDTLTYYINDSRFIKTNTSTFQWQTGFEDSGNHTFIVNVSDGQLNATKSFNAEVKEKNQPPILNGTIPTQTWNEDTNHSLNLSEYFYELDSSDNLTFGVSNTSKYTQISIVSIANGTINFTVEENWTGTDWIIFFAYDGEEVTKSNNVTLIVSPVNDAPFLAASIPNQTLNEDVNLSLNLSNYFTDIDSQLNYSAIGNSQFNVSFSGNIATFTPAKDWNGEETIKINASDGEFNISSNEFKLTVSPANDAPVLNGTIPTLTWNEDTSFSFNLSEYFYEVDPADSLTFGVSNTSRDTHISVESFVDGTINFTVGNNWNGADWIIFFANDSKNITKSNNVTLIVSPVNDAPFLAASIPNQTLNEDVNLSLNLSNYFTDIDSQLNYSAIGNSQFNVSFSGNIATFTPAKDWNGEETIIINASDSEFNISSNEFKLTVSPANDAPVLDFINDTLVLAGELVDINITATDLEGDALDFSFSSPLDQSGHWQTSTQDAGNYIVTANVYDNNGGSDSQQFKIQVLQKFYINEFVSTPINGSEWVELYNSFNQTINLSNCILKDGADNVFNLSGTLGRREFTVIEINNKLNNPGDTIMLYCANKLVDSVTYGNWDDGNLGDNAEAPGFGISASRNPDGLDTGNNFEDFELFEYPTRGLASNTDFFAPVVELLSPSNNTLITATRDVTFEFIATDNMAEILECDVYLNRVLKATDKNIHNNTNESIVVNDVLDGTYNWNVRCYDQTNYTFAPNNRTFSMDGPNNPILSSIGTKSVNENEKLEFKISATDQDLDNLFFSMQNSTSGATLVDNLNKTAVFSWTPTYEQSGDYYITFIVNDSHGLGDQETIKISVINQKTPPKFSDIDRCEVKNSNLKLSITDPNSGEAFEVGEKISIKSEIENAYSEELDVDMKIYLYDLTEDEVIDDDKENSITIDKGKHAYQSFEFTIPEDLEEGEFAIFALAEGENSEVLCNEDFVYIDIQRKEHEIEITDTSISQDSVLPGDSFEVTVDMQNMGGTDEDVYVEVKNTRLGILTKSEEFELESYGNSDEESITLTMEVPQNAKEGNYSLEIKIIADETQDSTTEIVYVIKEEEISGSNVVYIQEGRTEAAQQKEKLIKLSSSQTQNNVGAGSSSGITGAVIGGLISPIGIFVIGAIIVVVIGLLIGKAILSRKKPKKKKSR